MRCVRTLTYYTSSIKWTGSFMVQYIKLFWAFVFQTFSFNFEQGFQLLKLILDLPQIIFSFNSVSIVSTATFDFFIYILKKKLKQFWDSSKVFFFEDLALSLHLDFPHLLLVLQQLSEWNWHQTFQRTSVKQKLVLQIFFQFGQQVFCEQSISFSKFHFLDKFLVNSVFFWC